MPTKVPLQSVVLTENTSTITFANIDQTYMDLEIVTNARCSHTSNVNMYYRINNDSTSSYSVTRLQGNGSTAVSNRGTSNTVGYLGYADGTDTATGIFNCNTIYVNNYSNTTTYKTLLCKSSTPGTGGTSAIFVNLYSGSTNAVSSITLGNDAGSFVAGSTFDLYAIKAGSARATGGQVFNDGTYYYHVFKSSGLFTVQQDSSLSCDYLVVAGGGGGGNGFGGAGGGGAGGYRSATGASLSGGNSYLVTIGAGGAGGSGGSPSRSGTKGIDSIFNTITSTGGGYGATGGNGGSGGSGGGAGWSGPNGGAGNTPSTSPSQGNNGGNVVGDFSGGGGGGAGGAGGNSNNSVAGNGGAGSNAHSTWASATSTGVSGYFAGGGGGGGNAITDTAGTGGSGGGGNGGKSSSTTGIGQNATANTGSGGGAGGGGYATGGNGAGGIVIVRYAV